MRFLAVIFIVFFISGCEKKEEISSNIISTNNTQNKKILLKDIDNKNYEFEKNGNGFDFGQFKNKVILLDFFASWCPPCKAEIPHLINLQNEFKDNFQIVGILLEDDKPITDTKEFIKENGINYVVLTSGDISKLVKSVGGVRSIPFMIMYDNKGEYFTHYIGAVPEEMIASDIKRAIK